ncbi:hypothetical protein [Bacillus thuringiensis]
MAKIKGLTIELNVEATEALKQTKEVTEAANECVAALDSLEKAMRKFRLNREPIKFDLPTTVWGTAIQQATDTIKLDASKIDIK